LLFLFLPHLLLRDTKHHFWTPPVIMFYPHGGDGRELAVEGLEGSAEGGRGKYRGEGRSEGSNAGL
jgi:hypothetical protein